MAGDTVGSGETFDGGDAQIAPERSEPEAAPDYADPAAEAAAPAPDTADGDNPRDLADFEPETDDTDHEDTDASARPPSLAPAEVTDDNELDNADDAAARAREEADRQALPAEQTKARIENTDPSADPPPAPAAPPKPAADTDAEPPEDSISEQAPGADGDRSGDTQEDVTSDTAGAAVEDDEADRHTAPGNAAATVGHTAVEAEVEPPDQAIDEDTHDHVPAEGEGDLADVVEVDEVISEHEREAAADGRDKAPEIDLQELQDLMELIEPGSALILSQHDWAEGDDSWVSGRDAAGSGAGQSGQDNVVYPDFVPAAGAADNSQATSGERTAPVVLLNRDAVPADETSPPGDWIDEVLPEVAEDDLADTPQGARPYPPELVNYTDALMMQGDAGEEQAIQLLEHYDSTGQLPEWLIPQPAQSPETMNEALQEDATQPLF